MLEKTAHLSLRVQILTVFIDGWGLTLKVDPASEIFKELLHLEFAVQTIEMIFYIWMVRNMTKVPNITAYRYIDWVFTTPIMLLSLIVFLDHEEGKIVTLKESIKSNESLLKKVIGLNMAMLTSGFLGEVGAINAKTGAAVGFLPFAAYWKAIYDQKVKNKASTDVKRKVFWYFVVVWALYRVVAPMPYQEKNAMYNVLDLFEKNFFGIFLVLIVWQKHKKISWPNVKE
jgi:hypothetical protein